MTLSWDPVTGATDYELHAGTSTGGVDIFAGRIGLRTSLSTRLPAGFSAFVRLYSLAACGRSLASNEVPIQFGGGGGPSTIWRGTTAQSMPIELTIRNNAVEAVIFRAQTTSNPACPIITNTRWVFQPPVAIVNDTFRLAAMAPPLPIADFEINGTVTAPGMASGTLFVRLGTQNGDCVGTGTTTWTARQQ